MLRLRLCPLSLGTGVGSSPGDQGRWTPGFQLGRLGARHVRLPGLTRLCPGLEQSTQVPERGLAGPVSPPPIWTE